MVDSLGHKKAQQCTNGLLMRSTAQVFGLKPECNHDATEPLFHLAVYSWLSTSTSGRQSGQCECGHCRLLLAPAARDPVSPGSVRGGSAAQCIEVGDSSPQRVALVAGRPESGVAGRPRGPWGGSVLEVLGFACRGKRFWAKPEVGAAFGP